MHVLDVVVHLEQRLGRIHHAPHDDRSDLDYAQALTKMNQQLVGLQAAQLSYTKISGLSLFNYLR